MICCLHRSPLRVRDYSRNRQAHTRAAFTLVELLVSMAVLVMLMLMIVQMVNSATNITSLSQARLDADSQAREVFDRMTRDFNGMIRRPDVDCSIYPYSHYGVHPVFKAGGNDYLFFFSQTAAINAAGQSHENSTVADAIAIMGYRIWEGPASSTLKTAPFALERNASSANLNIGTNSGGLVADRPMLFLTSGTKSSYLTNPGNADGSIVGTNGTMPLAHQYSDSFTYDTFHVIGDQVFRLEFALQMTPEYIAKNGGTLAYSTAPYWKSVAYNSTPLTQQIQDMRDVSAIIVTIALLDHGSRVKIPGYDPVTPANSFIQDMQGLRDALIDGDTPSVATSWADALTKIATSTETPKRTLSPITRTLAAKNIRIYQRTFNLK